MKGIGPADRAPAMSTVAGGDALAAGENGVTSGDANGGRGRLGAQSGAFPPRVPEVHGQDSGGAESPRSAEHLSLKTGAMSQPEKTGQRAGMPTAAVADCEPSRARFLQECLASTRAHSCV